MNKSGLQNAFPMVATSTINKIEDEWRIVGKFCQVTHFGKDEWDLWLCDPSDLAKGLSARKLGIILQKLREEATFTELEGEAYANVKGKDFIAANLDLLGIKRKRILSESELVARRNLIREINAKKYSVPKAVDGRVQG